MSYLALCEREIARSMGANPLKLGYETLHSMEFGVVYIVEAVSALQDQPYNSIETPPNASQISLYEPTIPAPYVLGGLSSPEPPPLRLL